MRGEVRPNEVFLYPAWTWVVTRSSAVQSLFGSATATRARMHGRQGVEFYGLPLDEPLCFAVSMYAPTSTAEFLTPPAVCPDPATPDNGKVTRGGGTGRQDESCVRARACMCVYVPHF